MSLNGELRRDTISSRQPAQMDSNTPLSALKILTVTWHRNTVTLTSDAYKTRSVQTENTVSSAAFSPQQHSWWQSSCPGCSPIPSCLLRGVTGFNLPSGTCCDPQPGLTRWDSHQSLRESSAVRSQDEQWLRWFWTGELGPYFFFGLHKFFTRLLLHCVWNFPLCPAPWKGWGLGVAFWIPG